MPEPKFFLLRLLIALQVVSMLKSWAPCHGLRTMPSLRRQGLARFFAVCVYGSGFEEFRDGRLGFKGRQARLEQWLAATAPDRHQE